MAVVLATCSTLNESAYQGMQSAWYQSPSTHHVEVSMIADGAILPNGATLTSWKTANGIAGGACILTRPSVETGYNTRQTWGQYNLLDWFGATIDLTSNALLKIRLYTNHPEVSIRFGIDTSPWTGYSYNPPTLVANAWNEVPFDLRLSRDGTVPDLSLFRTIELTVAEQGISQDVANEYFLLIDYITVEPATAPIPLQANISPKSARLKTSQTAGIACVAAGGTGNYTFKWFLDNALMPTTTKDYVFVAGSAGTYKIHAQVNDGIETVTTTDVVITVVPQLPPPVPARPLHCSGNRIYDDTNKKFRFTGSNTTAGFLDRTMGVFQDENGVTHWEVTTFVDQLPYIQQYIDGLRSWGFNSTRDHLAVDFWIKNTDNYPDNIRTYLQMLTSNGLTPVIDFYSIQGGANTRGGSVPLPMYMNAQELSVTGWTSPQDFANFWGSVATFLKDLPVVFDIWNEPAYDANNNGIDPQTLWANWFPAVQLAINAIRATGATNPIMIEVGMGPSWNFSGDSGETLDWITQYPLSDPLGSLIYSSHIYRSFTSVGWWYLNSPIWSFDTRATAYKTSDIDYAWGKMKYPEILSQVPFVVGEIGVVGDGTTPPLLYDKLNSTPSGGTSAERVQAEFDAVRYIFQKLKDAEVGWLAWWFRSSVGWFSLTQASPNYPPTAGGVLIQEALATSLSLPFHDNFATLDSKWQKINGTWTI